MASSHIASNRDARRIDAIEAPALPADALFLDPNGRL